MKLFLTILIVLAVLVLLSHLRARRMARHAQNDVPRAGRMQQVDGGAIHYVESGNPEGPVLLLIHGLSGQLQNFTYALSDELSDFRVIAIDRPGCGYSERDASKTGLFDQAGMIADFMQLLNLEKAVVVGHSLGGAVALAMAMNHPAKVRGLALICPATHMQDGAPDVFKGLEIRSAWLRRLIGNTIAPGLAKRTTDMALTSVFKPQPWPRDFLIRGGGALGYRPKSFVAASEDLVAAERDMPQMIARYGSDLNTPGGVFYAEEDNVLSPARHGVVMQEFGLSYETLPNSGHMVPMTHPKEVADFVARMVAKVQA